jgi:hypothetical protein
MAVLTARLKHRIQRDFPVGTANEVARHLTALTATAFGGQDQERVMAAIVLASAGQWGRFRPAIRLATTDWRDVLVPEGLPAQAGKTGWMPNFRGFTRWHGPLSAGQPASLPRKASLYKDRPYAHPGVRIGTEPG